MMLRSSDDMLTHVKTAKSQTDGLERILFNINKYGNNLNYISII